jgi:hypothetical protein
MDYLLDVNAAREEHVHELAVGGTRAQLLNFRIPRITTYVIYDNVERPDPKGLSTFSQCTEFFSPGDSNSCPPDVVSPALTKCLASRC